tara:strand:+ start:54943 stop:55176 length:234 start_codon:yes stop_codon:yes gene_type:complete
MTADEAKAKQLTKELVTGGVEYVEKMCEALELLNKINFPNVRRKIKDDPEFRKLAGRKGSKGSYIPPQNAIKPPKGQ